MRAWTRWTLWTVVVLASFAAFGQQTIHVSNSGADTADGSEGAPVATLARAAEIVLAATKPTEVLLARGGVWQDEEVFWKNDGVTIVAYGEGPRPLVRHMRFRGTGINVRDIHFRPVLDADGLPPGRTGIGNHGTLVDFTVERCLLEYCGITISPNVAGALANIAIRDTVVYGSFAEGAHAQGVYIADTHGVRIEGCLIDRNGWHPEFAEATIYNHGAYLQWNNSGVEVRDTVFSRSSSHGLQMRSGGILKRCVFLDNACDLSFAFSRAYGGDPRDTPQATGRITDNVFVGARDISEQLPRGMPIEIGNCHDVTIAGNIVGNPRSVGGWKHGIIVNANTGPVDRLVIRDNVINDFRGIKVGGERARDIWIVDNYISDVTLPGPRSLLMEIVDGADVSLAGNHYYSYRSLPWSSIPLEVGATYGPRDFVEPTRMPSGEMLDYLRDHWNGAGSAAQLMDLIRGGYAELIPTPWEEVETEMMKLRGAIDRAKEQ
jgi:hypothetical protein